MSVPRTAQAQRVMALTKKLVGIQSGPSPHIEGEQAVARFIKVKLIRSGVEAKLLRLLDRRENVFAFLPAEHKTPNTLVMFGHTDTVGIDDYGALADAATQPSKLRRAMINEEAEKEAIADLKTGEWLCGRGALDMKSGLAIEMDVIERLARRPAAGNIIFIGACDKENSSAGILQAVLYLREFAANRGLRLLGAINADYTTRRFDSDQGRYIYLGTVGKLIPSFLILGKTFPVGEAWCGIDANLIAAELIRQIELNTALCDTSGKETTLPPVTFRCADFKSISSVPTTLSAWVYFNIFTHDRTPEEVMRLMHEQAEIAAAKALARIQNSYQAFTRLHGPALGEESLNFSIPVISLAELKGSNEIISKVAWKIEDPREKSRLIVHDLWDRSGREGAAIIPFLSPPYYPSGNTGKGKRVGLVFISTAKRVAREMGVKARYFYPYVSDASFLGHSGGVPDLGRHMPLWRQGYSLPLEEMAALGLPVVNIGPWGMDAHKRTERVHIPYSFGVVPKLMEAVIRETFEKERMRRL